MQKDGFGEAPPWALQIIAQMQAFQQGIKALTQEVQHILQRLDEMEIKRVNSFAHAVAHLIEWFLLPQVPFPLAPATTPRTRGELFTLSNARCNTLLGYYGLPLPAKLMHLLTKSAGLLPLESK
mmetsp:Transcript_5611/g.8334  ORF Transcript_5611/g.8334 Transcript_5611/m.8334 type:complete len:124 (+) Transcript_5611:528-899(+)